MTHFSSCRKYWTDGCSDWRPAYMMDHLFICLTRPQMPNLTWIWINNLTLGLDKHGVSIVHRILQFSVSVVCFWFSGCHGNDCSYNIECNTELLWEVAHLDKILLLQSPDSSIFETNYYTQVHNNFTKLSNYAVFSRYGLCVIVLITVTQLTISPVPISFCIWININHINW